MAQQINKNINKGGGKNKNKKTIKTTQNTKQKTTKRIVKRGGGPERPKPNTNYNELSLDKLLQLLKTQQHLDEKKATEMNFMKKRTPEKAPPSKYDFFETSEIRKAITKKYYDSCKAGKIQEDLNYGGFETPSIKVPGITIPKDTIIKCSTFLEPGYCKLDKQDSNYKCKLSFRTTGGIGIRHRQFGICNKDACLDFHRRKK